MHNLCGCYCLFNLIGTSPVYGFIMLNIVIFTSSCCLPFYWYELDFLLLFQVEDVSIATCGRTVRNNTLTEVLVFHQTLSTPKASYRGRYPSGTPKGRTRKIHIFPKDPIMKTSYNTCPFHTSEFLKSILLQYQMSECGMINNGI